VDSANDNTAGDEVGGGCWGSGPAHVRVSGPLCGLEGFLVNTASTGGSEENNH
jgi:hypothetical protein